MVERVRSEILFLLRQASAFIYRTHLSILPGWWVALPDVYVTLLNIAGCSDFVYWRYSFTLSCSALGGGGCEKAQYWKLCEAAKVCWLGLRFSKVDLICVVVVIVIDLLLFR